VCGIHKDGNEAQQDMTEYSVEVYRDMVCKWAGGDFSSIAQANNGANGMQALVERYPAGNAKQPRNVAVDIPAGDDLSRYQLVLRMKVWAT
jgi:hypothetical protein